MTILDVLLLVLPNEFLPLLIAIASLGVLVGLVRPRRVSHFIGMLVIAAALTPFIEALFAELPWWVGLATMLLLSTWMARAVLDFVFGREATGHIVGTTVVSLATLVFRVLLLPVRLVARGLAGMPERGR